MAKYFRIAEIDAATFERMTGDELDCLQVAMLADDGNVYVAVDEDGQDYIDVDLEIFDTDGGAVPRHLGAIPQRILRLSRRNSTRRNLEGMKMAEYIKRSVAIAYIREQSEECQKAFEELGGESGIYADAYNDLAEDFYRIPAADVAPVVRCKDCVHWDDDPDTYGADDAGDRRIDRLPVHK